MDQSITRACPSCALTKPETAEFFRLTRHGTLSNRCKACINASKVHLAWSEAEDCLLRQEFPSGDLKELALLLNRRQTAVQVRASKLGIRRAPAKKREILHDTKNAHWFVRLDPEAQLAVLEENIIRQGKSLKAFCQEIGIGRRGLWQRAKNLGFKLPNRSEGLRRRWRNASDADRKAMLSRAHEKNRELWSDPAWAQAMATKLRDAQSFQESRHERDVRLVLEGLGIEFIPQKQMANWFVDFYIPSMKLVIECDGDYWHSKPERVESDRRKDSWLVAHKLRIVRIWGSVIDEDPHVAVMQALGLAS